LGRSENQKRYHTAGDAGWEDTSWNILKCQAYFGECLCLYSSSQYWGEPPSPCFSPQIWRFTSRMKISWLKW
jgi:hypothetical protein